MPKSSIHYIGLGSNGININQQRPIYIKVVNYFLNNEYEIEVKQ